MCLSAVPTYFALSFLDLTTGTRLAVSWNLFITVNSPMYIHILISLILLVSFASSGSDRLLTIISFPISS
jgi:hypothetical protein